MSELPPLPEPSFQLVWLGDRAIYKVTKPNIGNTDVYTAEQMQAYARAVVQAAQPEAVGCGLCGADEPFTGSCGGGRNNPAALCFASAPTPEPMSAPTAEPDEPSEFAHWLNARRDLRVAQCFHEIVERFTDLATPPSAATEPSDAERDVLTERKRQINVEGYNAAEDDEYDEGMLAQAAACYATALESTPAPMDWPWPLATWKPKTFRSNLVRAGALILAEIERLDRATKGGKL